MMAKKKFYIWLENEVAESFRKRAISEGKTLSETGEDLIRKALEERLKFETGISENFQPGTVFDQTLIINAIKPELFSLKTSIEKLAGSRPTESSILTREILIFLVDYLTRTYSMSLAISAHQNAGEHPNRVAKAKSGAETMLKKIFGEGAENERI